MTFGELKAKIYEYLLEKADASGKVEFTYEELAAKFISQRYLYQIMHKLRREKKLRTLGKTGSILHYEIITDSKEARPEEENMCEVKVELTGAALRPALTREMERTAQKFLESKNQEEKMALAEEFTKLFAAEKNQQALTTTARLPFSMLRDRILEQVPARRAGAELQEQEDTILGVA